MRTLRINFVDRFRLPNGEDDLLHRNLALLNDVPASAGVEAAGVGTNPEG